MNKPPKMIKFLYLSTALLLTACGGETPSGKDTVAEITTPGTGNLSVDLTSNKNTVEPSGSVTLSWTTSGAEQCESQGDWSGNRVLQGSDTIDPIEKYLNIDDYKKYMTFTLVCTGNNQVASDSITIKVSSATDTTTSSPPPTISLNSNALNIPYLGSVNLNWNTNDANSCIASGGWSGNRSTSGTEQVDALPNDSYFTLTCSGDGGQTSATLFVTVQAQPTTGKAVLSWTKPTLNDNGSNLTDLAGYKIYFGTSAGNYTKSISITDPTLTTYTIDNLTINTKWYFVMTAFNTNSIESVYSQEASTTVQ